MRGVRDHKNLNSSWRCFSGPEAAPLPAIFISENLESPNCLWIGILAYRQPWTWCAAELIIRHLTSLGDVPCCCCVQKGQSAQRSLLKVSQTCHNKTIWQELTAWTWSEVFDDLGISLLLTINPVIQYTNFDQPRKMPEEGRTRFWDSVPVSQPQSHLQAPPT